MKSSLGETTTIKSQPNKMDAIFKDYFKMNLGKLSLRVYEYITFYLGNSEEIKQKKK